jgi:hypothetical protein
MDKAPIKYVGMSVTPEARDAFRTIIAIATGQTRRQVGVSETMLAVSHLAERHMAELVAYLEED